jgi:hypothetical protein
MLKVYNLDVSKFRYLKLVCFIIVFYVSYVCFINCCVLTMYKLYSLLTHTLLTKSTSCFVL